MLYYTLGGKTSTCKELKLLRQRNNQKHFFSGSFTFQQIQILVDIDTNDTNTSWSSQDIKYVCVCVHIHFKNNALKYLHNILIYGCDTPRCDLARQRGWRTPTLSMCPQKVPALEPELNNLLPITRLFLPKCCQNTTLIPTQQVNLEGAGQVPQS